MFTNILLVVRIIVIYNCCLLLRYFGTHNSNNTRMPNKRYETFYYTHYNLIHKMKPFRRMKEEKGD